MRINFNMKTSIVAVGLIIITVLARWVSVFIPVSFLSNFRKFNPSVLLIMTWGGLRGGISIALALSIDGDNHDFIVSITYAVVLFSIMVQGLTIGPLIKKVVRTRKTPA